ncbi:isochorismatase [Gilliamella apicola]|uniref:Cysteine hydrolase n=1 Tax=Gilliamella apicola TaxID=1196095 RepID=A0A556SQK1_9GAMM|nr:MULTISPECIES: isochorismatase family cysteine hydrolase [Gilliamella]MBI0094813.1 cysteine hydrolase [Gilliamella sp. W8136]OTP92744.1 isochorismatase [Gilliamella apicola]OTQ17314.1 isochorismatase [Gilliamella apicola]OTQ19955.1 isochorismatase [Gilliamella apicola]OTQ24683.1 isochorismatase [Gilliamella apicola]
MKALISIDYTNDFIADDGALTTGLAGQQIESEMLNITNSFIKNNQFIVFAIDAHDPSDEYHPENSLFPPHNIVGTVGQQLFGELHQLYQRYQNSTNIYWINKRHYSAFCGTDLDLRLRERHITEIHLIGVCTDICILHTAVDAYNLGYKIVIHQNAVASFDPIGHQWALKHFQNTLGATLI